MKTFLTLSASALILAACTQSNWLSDGYKHHSTSPISKPKQTSSWNEAYEDNNLNKNGDLTAVLSAVSADMLATLETHISRDTPIYLAPKNSLNGTTSILDHTLRTEFINNGYTLSSQATGAHMLAYDIEKSTTENATATEYIILIYGMTQEGWLPIDSRTQELPSVEN